MNRAEQWSRVRIGTLEVDRLSFAGALDAIEELVRSGKGGSVFTPNVDHVILAEDDTELRAAYAEASLRLADGMPLLWGARLLGAPLPEKVSGSDLILPLMRRAAERGWRVYLLGAAPGVASRAAERLQAEIGVTIAGVDDSLLSDPRDARERAPVLERIRQARPHLVLVALGAPKQELFIHHSREALGSAVGLGIGGSLDFIAGTTRRAPRWMSERGLEWLYRLLQEPRRLWRRYLLRDPRFAFVLLRALFHRRAALPQAS